MSLRILYFVVADLTLRVSKSVSGCQWHTFTSFHILFLVVIDVKSRILKLHSWLLLTWICCFWILQSYYLPAFLSAMINRRKKYLSFLNILIVLTKESIVLSQGSYSCKLDEETFFTTAQYLIRNNSRNTEIYKHQ